MSSMRIHRYILREISAPALLSLLIFSFVLLMGRIPRLTELVINKGVPLSQIVKLFGFLLPTFLSITVPLSFLLAILLAFGRLSADSEFIALKASGVSLYNLVKPVVALAVFFSLLTGLTTLYIEPASKTAFKSMLFQIASGSAGLAITPGVFNDAFDGIVLFTHGMDEQNGIMQDIFISDEREGEVPATIIARQGRLISNPAKMAMTLRLTDGTIHREPLDSQHTAYQIVRFSNYDINLDVAGQLNDQERRRSRGELSWGELSSALNSTQDRKTRLRLEVEKNQRVVIAFAPLVLVLVGIPLGLQSQRSGKGAGFSLALIVFLVYYILLSFAGTIAEKGVLPAALILWLPNICFFVGGLYFLHRTAIERPLQLFASPLLLLHKLLRLFKRSGAGQ